MECAAKALVGDGEGVVVILGTGSNSAYYRGGEKVAAVPALGYILGDEGSGAVLGRTLVGDILKGVAPQHIVEQFEAEYNLSLADILDSVYRQPLANRTLAAFTRFLKPRLGDTYIYNLVERCFELFVTRNLSQYPVKSIYATGSVAYHFEGVLRRVLEREGFRLVRVVQSPIEALAEYYLHADNCTEELCAEPFRRITEEPSYYDNLESMSVAECLRAINREDHRVPDAVERTLPAVERLVRELIPRLKRGGRLFYMGAGTSGRLGVLDASEVPPTFGMPPTVVIGIIAGGDKALRTPVEGAEDDTEQGWRDLEKFNPTPLDTVVGIAASGTTPYVVGVLRKAREQGLLTAAIASNRNSPAAQAAEIAIETVVGSEFVTGSSRMKSGTAQKLVCNMITTTAMIGIGRVRGNRMVNMQLSNQKLIDRGTRMIVDELGLPYDHARNLLLLHGSVELAIRSYYEQ
ncbi:MAG: N-acetylmuramic acid 6-phosphate etherase [Alistipes sp.]|nr:N-acetylmuramic acid 6-phosphate etherase [Alistipes sp.]